MRNKTCCFTGHRILQESEQTISNKIRREVLNLYDKGYLYFGVGGALGFDTIAAETLFRLRDCEGLKIKIILVAPFKGYNNLWAKEEKKKFDVNITKYDKVVFVSSVASKDAFLARNRHLINYSSVCITYLIDEYSGTGYTIKYAIKEGLNIINIAK